MTDNEIIKALKRCIDGTGKCNLCPMFENCKTDINALEKHTLDLINRQKAEVERLNLENLQMVASIKNLKAEAKKELAEEIKKALLNKKLLTRDDIPVIIDNLVKERIGDAE